MEKILRTCLFTPGPGNLWGLPMLFWGSPGTGKTSVIKAAAWSSGLLCEVLSPGERGEGAFGVVPVPSGNGTCLTYPPPDWALLLDATGGVVFVDELTTAPPAIQPALLGLVLARRIGGHQFNRRVRVIAASNPTDESAAGYDLPLPLANRFGHRLWEPGSVEEWSRWLISSSGDETPPLDAKTLEEAVLDAWPGEFSSAKGLAVSFLRKRPEFLHQQPSLENPAASRAFPTRRTWELAIRARAGAKIHGLSDGELLSMVAAFVGDGAAVEWSTYLSALDIPDFSALLDEEEKWKPNAKRLDVMSAVLSGCTSLVLPEKAEKREARSRVLLRLFDEAVGKAPDVALPSLILFLQKHYTALEADCAPLLRKLEPIVRLAELRPT